MSVVSILKLSRSIAAPLFNRVGIASNRLYSELTAFSIGVTSVYDDGILRVSNYYRKSKMKSIVIFNIPCILFQF